MGRRVCEWERVRVGEGEVGRVKLGEWRLVESRVTVCDCSPHYLGQTCDPRQERDYEGSCLTATCTRRESVTVHSIHPH